MWSATNMKAFGYLRVSGKGQIDGDGFPRQRAAIQAYAGRNGIDIVDWFEERGISGSTEWEDRPAWSAMVERFNGVRTIIVERLDRLARDLFVQEYILRDLAKRDIQLLTAAGEETGDADPTRVLFRQMLGAIAQYDRTMIVKKLRAARNRMKQETGRCEGQKPYGVDSAEVAAIERMRALRASGQSFDTIASGLNDMGLKTRHNAKWYGCTVSKILAANS